MSAHVATAAPAPLDLSKWRNLPNWLMGVGGLGVLLGAAVPALRQQFAFSWLLAFMLFLSLCLGGLFLVLMHPLFDAGWSVPIRRLCEHLACLLPVMGILFLPIAVLAPKMYPWMKLALAGHPDHALRAKLPLFTLPMFYLVAAFCFGVWWLLSRGLRHWSLKQDETGSAECSYKMRLYSYWGIFAFAITLSLAAIMWVKALYHEWFSTMYGVYYFAGSVWMTLATVYLATALLKRQGPLREVGHRHGNRLRPLRAAVPGAAAHRHETGPAGDGPALRVGVADALLRSFLQHHADFAPGQFCFALARPGLRGVHRRSVEQGLFELA